MELAERDCRCLPDVVATGRRRSLLAGIDGQSSGRWLPGAVGVSSGLESTATGEQRTVKAAGHDGIG